MRRTFNTDVLDQCLRRNRAENETNRKRTVRQIMSALPKLAEKYGLREAYVFGSLTKPNGFRRNSDVDLAVEGLRNEDYFALRAELVRAVGREIDILQLERHPWRERILESGIKWKTKN